MSKFESKKVLIAHPTDRIFAFLSDLSNLEKLQGKFNSPENDKIKVVGYNQDSLTIEVNPVGQLTFRIVERDPNKTIKFEAENSPLPLTMWVQLVTLSDTETASRVTLSADLNPFIKPMISKPLQEGVDKMADMLVVLPY